VSFGGALANFTVDSDTEITATAPSHLAGMVSVTVSNTGVSASGSFTYVTAAVVSGVGPASGPALGGTQGPRIKSSTFSGRDLKKTRGHAKDGMGIHANATFREVTHGKVSLSFPASPPQVLRYVA
jgi:hypothetical protein